MDMRRKLMLQVYHMSSIIIQDHLLQKGDVMETVCISTHQPVTRQCIVEHMLITPQLLVIPIGFMKEAVAIVTKAIHQPGAEVPVIKPAPAMVITPRK